MPRIKVDVEPGISGEKVVPGLKVEEKVAEKVETPTVSTQVDSGKEAGLWEKVSAVVSKEVKQASGKSMLSAFLAMPSGVAFSGEQSDEEIVLLLRAHLVTNVVWILVTLGLLLAPLIILPLFSAGGLETGVGAGLGFIMILFWYLGTFTYAFLNFLYWYFNVYIVTNERVVDIDWYSVIVKRVSSAPVSKIQDVSTLQVGVFAGLFDFGDVHVQTAGEEANFEFKAVPHPHLVAKQIQELMEEEEKEWETNPNIK